MNTLESGFIIETEVILIESDTDTDMFDTVKLLDLKQIYCATLCDMTGELMQTSTSL